MKTQADIIQIIQERYSCRSFQDIPLSEGHLATLAGEAPRVSLLESPFAPAPGGCRITLAASGPGDESALKGLGTYGFIKKPQAFLIAVIKSDADLEESGWKLEQLVLKAQDLGIGSCWLGGSFRRSRFSEVATEKLGDFIQEGSSPRIPAVIALGYPDQARDPKNSWARVKIGGHRKPASQLFFARPAPGTAATPLLPLEPSKLPAEFARALEMVRIGPSASNKQPWRVVYDPGEKCFHFFLCRSPKYRDGLIVRLLGTEDIQRVDSGIAVSHFQAAMESSGSKGTWTRKYLADNISGGENWDYVITFCHA